MHVHTPVVDPTKTPTLDAAGLSEQYLHKSADSILDDLRRNPDRVPPCFKPAKRPLWVRTTVEKWCAEEERKRLALRQVKHVARGRPTKREQVARAAAVAAQQRQDGNEVAA